MWKVLSLVTLSAIESKGLCINTFLGYFINARLMLAIYSKGEMIEIPILWFGCNGLTNCIYIVLFLFTWNAMAEQLQGSLFDTVAKKK